MQTMTESTCSCQNCQQASASDAAAGRVAIERPRFFARQLVTPDDLTLGYDYLRNKMRRINRYLHGWGVVCGTRVDLANKPWKVIVRPGYILGPFGDEIVIERDICFDIRTRCVQVEGGDACDDILDPLCADRTTQARDPAQPVYVAVRYKEFASRPVRVQPAGCGCDDTSCEYSRWRDGYEICVLDDCPDDHLNPPDLATLDRPPGGIPDCPPCPTDPWVVLAEVTADKKGAITRIDNCKCRRMVVSLAQYWRKCGEPAQAPAPAPAPTPVPSEGGSRPPE
jgi:hypothetical protein